MSEAILPLPQYAFMVWCSVKKKHRDKIFHLFFFATNIRNYRSIPNVPYSDLGRMWEEAVVTCFKELYRKLSGGTEENHENLSQGNRSPRRIRTGDLPNKKPRI